MPCCPTTCAGKICGDNGCGGTCGDCPSGATCDGGQCVCAAGNKPCGDACIDNSWCCTEQECAADQSCPTPGQGRCCTRTGNACPPTGSVIQCCTGRCGDRDNTAGKCCIAAGDPCDGTENCCNGSFACTTNQQGVSVCA
ncbi:MAG TPA: hypothetical protein VFX03_00520 [Thermomicrobiales bacterium]|nr:hypothetical protein [Thermomicrobiales bacterium]